MSGCTSYLLRLLAIHAAMVATGVEGDHRLPLERVRKGSDRPANSDELLAAFRPGGVPAAAGAAAIDSNAFATSGSEAKARFDLISAIPQPEQLVAAAAASAVSEKDLLLNTHSYADVRRQLQNEGDSIYILRAKVGTPQRPVRLVVDTGSSDMWVSMGSYDADLSSTAKFLPGDATLLRYGRGQVSGKEVEDLVCLEAPLCVKDQTFITAKSIVGLGDTAGSSGLFDGLLGLAYPALSAAKGVTFLKELLDHGPWKRLAFGLLMSRFNDQEGSFIVFGELEDVLAEAPGPASEASASEGVAVPVLDVNEAARFWLVGGVVSMKLQGVDLMVESQVFAALDSGTSLITVPASAYNWVVWSLIGADSLPRCGPALGQVLCPCSTRMQNLSFDFPGKEGKQVTITLTLEDLLQPIGQAIYPSGEQVMMCRVNIQPGPAAMPFWILGDVFLRRAYVVHDVRGQQVVLFPRPSEDLSKAVAAEIAAPMQASTVQAICATMVLVVAVLLTALFATTMWRRRQASARSCTSNSLEEEAVGETMRAEYMRL